MSPYKEVTPNKGVWGVKGSFIYPFFLASLWQPNTPMHSRIAEIESYLRHNDHSLAVRRILDASLDTADGVLLQEAIQVSQTYRQYKHTELPATFFESAHNLLNKLNTVTERFVEQSTRLVTARDISKAYSSGNFSLQPISIQVNTGDVLGVVGENGNGKTTLLRCMAGQLALD